MTSHPDVEALAFFAEELLEPDEERTVATHIDTCAICAATLEELTGVSEALAAAPAPELPRDVADLLDQRVAEAARERAAHTSDNDRDDREGADDASTTGRPVPHAAVPGGATVTPLPRRRRKGSGRVNVPRLMMVAAAAVVIGGGGAAVFDDVMSGGQGSTGVSAPLLEEGGGEAAEPEPHIAQSYMPQVVRSETVYTEASLSEQAARTLDLAPVGEADGTEPMTTLETAPTGMQECVSRLSEELGTHFSLVDEAHYGDEESPAWVLFSSPPDDRYEVYVVSPACARGGDAGRSVLAQETVRSP
ncbi:hypothetical protein [Nocardiopsis halotolerans]|uniref:hypothetical protein n=1 Tax=Nocardiopsis halotolerans TaxID=124252 RepID=UPI000345E7B5|nr:hypothetical protein [Nocardiopsis halotolerans]